MRTNWVDASFALVNGAATFLTPADGVTRPHDVRIEPPPGWLRSLTGLPDSPDKAPHHYVAPDYDTLVDCPIVVGNPTVYEFEVDGKPHFLVNEGEGGVWDGPRSAKDVETIVRAQRAFWGQLPYDKYLFFNLIVESGGGLEHKNSTVLMTSRWATRTAKAYRNWLELASHEFFHVWNVKRLRPAELGPFDYENETPTKTLWVAEGLTEYFGRLICRRAGLESRESYLAGDPAAKPGEEPPTEIAALQTTHGRKVQPLESASYDAWIKFYRPDENTRNTAVSYYTKGAVVGFLLDAEIRRATAGKKSLDDVMRLAYDRYSADRGYTSRQFREVAAEVAGADLAPWFKHALETTEELDYAKALDWYGLRFKVKEPPKDGKPPKAWLGLGTKAENGRLTVAHVRRGTPGHDAGFNVGDEILGIDDFRVGPEQWSDRMEQFRPNEKASILIARRERLIRLDATFAAEPAETWALEVRPDATDEQKSPPRRLAGKVSAPSMNRPAIDLRSDTVTKPTAAMNRAMAEAEVGDDVYGEDPTVKALERKVAELLGKEAALFVPSGTMSNQIAIGSHCQPGDELICGETAHVYVWEGGGPARLWGATARTIPGDFGMLSAADLIGKIRPDDGHYVSTRLVCLENTHNRAGGRVHPIEDVTAISLWARSHGLGMHLDGARLMNAVVASALSAATLAEPFDTISVCFSKGLGAPVGSALAGPADLIKKGHRLRKVLGGGMRQAGSLAGAAIYALDHHVDRLAEDHANALILARAVEQTEGLSLESGPVETNLVWITVDPGLGTAPDLAARLKAEGGADERARPAGAPRLHAPRRFPGPGATRRQRDSIARGRDP